MHIAQHSSTQAGTAAAVDTTQARQAQRSRRQAAGSTGAGRQAASTAAGIHSNDSRDPCVFFTCCIRGRYSSAIAPTTAARFSPYATAWG